MVRALASHARGQGFKSLCLHHAKAPLNGVFLRGENRFRKTPVLSGVHASERKRTSNYKPFYLSRTLPCHLVWQIPFVGKSTPKRGVFAW